MNRATTTVMTTALLLALGATGPRADQRVRIATSAAYAFAPALLRIQVRVEPNAAHRTLMISADSGGYYRSSLIELEGDTSARTFVVDFKQLPAGRYELSAAVRNGNGDDVGVATKGIRILGTGEQF